MRQISGKRDECSGLRHDVERLRPVDAEGTPLAVLAGAREEHHDRDAPRELPLRVGQHVTMSSIESAVEVSEKTRTFVARQADIEEPRDMLTDTGERTLDFLRGCRIDVHLQCPADLAINDEPVGMHFSRCRFAAFHRGSDAVTPLPIAEIRGDENSVLRCHARRDSKMAMSPVPDLSIMDAVRVPDDVIFRELNGEGVVLNLHNGTYFGLNSVGMRIWQLCEQHGSLREVWEAMQGEFDAPGDALQSDLLAFVNELSSRRLLRRQ